MLQVGSEVGRLATVLVHEPGAEVDRMVPAMMEELLFDDIVFGDRAREEHRRFRRILQLLGVEVLLAEDMLLAALAREDARRFVCDLLADELPDGVACALRDARPEDLLEAVVRGVRHRAPGDGSYAPEALFEMPPVPNWCFQRDPQVVLGDGVLFSIMATAARAREALLARVLFRFHPRLAGTPVWLDALETRRERAHVAGLHAAALEGGDVLVLAPDVIAVGISERTNRAGLAALVRALHRRAGAPRWVVAVELPARRAYMHLDTLFTPVDRDAALVYTPVLRGQGPEAAHVAEFDLHEDDPVARHAPPLLEALRRRGVDLEPIACGGDDPVAQQREQWTDGANAFAIAPGVIVLYDRNVATAETLGQHGFRIVAAEDLLLGRAEIDVARAGRTAILLRSHELSRARGGPHCLTHPLVRAD